MLNVPNSLTLMRILAVPLFLNLLVDELYEAALLVFVVAGLTDAADGIVARLTNTRTELGAHLDPLADKLLVIASFIALGILGEIPLRLMIMVIVRDVVILGGFILSAVVVGRSMAMAPSIWGKLTTFLQLLSICLVMLDLAQWLQVPDGPLQWIFFATGAATLISGVGYVLEGLRFYQASQEADG